MKQRLVFLCLCTICLTFLSMCKKSTESVTPEPVEKGLKDYAGDIQIGVRVDQQGLFGSDSKYREVFAREFNSGTVTCYPAWDAWLGQKQYNLILINDRINWLEEHNQTQMMHLLIAPDFYFPDSTLISLVDWTIYARLARAEAMKVKSQPYIEAIRAIGAKDLRIITFHVLPMSISPVIVQLTLRMGTIILTAAGLGFLGLGAQPPTPEWGAIVSDGRSYLVDQWWITTFPGIAIAIIVLGFNLLGDGIRDILDPRLRR